MAASESLTLESDWLPVQELRRLLDERQGDFPDVTVSVRQPSKRAFDPQIAVAVISGTSTLLTPFVTLLAARIFAKEPKAKLRLDGAAQEKDVVISVSLPEDSRAAEISAAIASGATRVRISIEPRG